METVVFLQSCRKVKKLWPCPSPQTPSAGRVIEFFLRLLQSLDVQGQGSRWSGDDQYIISQAHTTVTFYRDTHVHTYPHTSA